MKNYLRIAVFSVMLSMTVYLPAHAVKHNGEYAFHQVGFMDGLSHSSVLSMFQDNTGLVWFGTYDGLNCYDGKSMYVSRSDFSVSKTLSNNIISQICQADGDNLWVDTFFSLNRLSKMSGEVTHTYPFNSGRRMASNTHGNTWLICSDTLYYYSTTHEKFVMADEFDLGESPDRRFFTDEQGNMMYFCRDDGIVLTYSLSSWTSDSLSTKVTAKQERFHPKPIKDIFYQTGMMCFVDEDMDLYMYDVERRTKVYIRNLASLVEKYGTICGIVPFYEDFLIGFDVNGLFRLRAFDKYQAVAVDRNIRIFCLYHDMKQGVVWIGTDGHGALAYAKKYAIADNVLMSRISGGLSRPVRAMMIDKFGGLWIGTKGDGIVHLLDYENGARGAEIVTTKRRTPAEVYERDPREFKVYTLCESRFREGFWVGAGSEGLLFCPYNGLPRRLDLNVSEVHSIYEKDANTLYVASAGDGLHKVRLNGESVVADRAYSFYSEGHDVGMFYAMVSVGDSLLYAGSRGDGVVQLDMRTDEYSVISMKYLVREASDDVLSLCSASDGSLYVGTVSGLLHLKGVDEGIKAEYIGRKNGLSNDMIHGILEDEDGMIWLGTDRGLVKFNPENSSAHTYLYSAGLEVGEFSDDAYCRDRHSGKLLFGGINGVILLDPKSPEVSRFYADIQLRKLEVAHEEVKMSDYLKDGRLVFKGGKGSFALTFSAPDYVASDFLEYSYFLEGYDADWSVFTLSNKATYFDVPPGKYVLHVRYKKDVTDVSPNEFCIEVRVKGRLLMRGVSLLVFVGLLVWCFVLVRRGRSGRKGPELDKNVLMTAFGDTYDCALTVRSTLKEESDEVLRVLQGADLVDFRPSEVPFPVFPNLVKRLLMVCYGDFVERGEKLSVVAEVEDNVLVLRMKGRGVRRMLSRGDVSGERALHMAFLQLAMRQGVIEGVRMRGSELVIGLNAAASKQLAPADRERILLLESNEVTAWLLSDLLSADYEVVYAQDTSMALRSFKQSEFRLVIVDIHDTEDDKAVIGVLSRYKAALSGVPVVVLIGEQYNVSEFISRSDSYLRFNTDIALLKDVVSRAVQGKKDFSHIRLEELGSLSDEIVCSSEDDVAFVQKTIKVLSDNIAREDLSTTLIADRMAMTPRSFYRRFRSVSRISPGSFIKIYRLEMAARLLRDGSRQIQDVIAEVGISSRSYFYKEFTERFGKTPGNWKNTPDEECGDGVR